MIGTEEYIMDNLFLSFHDSIQFNIQRQETALDFVGKRYRQLKDNRRQKKPVDEARDFMSNIM